MTSSTTSPFSRFIGRLVAVLTIGALMLIVGTASAFAGSGHQVSGVASNAAPVVSTGGSVSLNEDDDDDDDDDDEDEEGGGGGGGLPATDTAPELSASGSSAPIAPIAMSVLMIAGLVGGTMRMAAKRTN